MLILLLFSLSFIIFMFTKTHPYVNQLFTLINLSNSNPVQTSLNQDFYFKKLSKQIHNTHIFWAMIWSPLALLTSIVIILNILNIIFDWQYTFILDIIPILLASIITPVLTHKPITWLNKWQHQLQHIINVDTLQVLVNQLTIYKQQLCSHVNGSNILPLKELNYLTQLTQLLIDNTITLTDIVNNHNPYQFN